MWGDGTNVFLFMLEFTHLGDLSFPVYSENVSEKFRHESQISIISLV